MVLRRFSTILALGLVVGGCETFPKILGSDLSSEQVSKTAKEITVIIDGCGAAGSGVVFKKDDKTYSVLTAYHVVKKAKGNCLILTSDGSQHKVAASDATVPVAGVDLAVLTFVSDKTYKLAKMGDSDKAVEGTRVSVAGAPESSKVMEERGMVVIPGNIIGVVSPSKVKGYGWRYDNGTSRGMSGGPVLNQKGELIGIHASGDERDGIDTRWKFGIPIKIFLNPDSLTAKGSQPKDAKDYYNQGLARTNQEDFNGAAADFSKAIELNPKYADAYYSLGWTYNELDKKEQAIANYSKAIELNPKLYFAYVSRGNAKSSLGEKEDAIKDYTEAIRIDSNYALAYYNRGVDKSSLGKKEDAIKDYTEAIQIDSNYALAYVGRGNAKSALGRKQDALADYEWAIQLDSSYALAYNNRGIVKYELGRKQDALADYERAIQLDPSYAIAYVGRGSAKSDLGKKQDAIADYDRAIQLDSNDAIAYVNRGVAKSALGKKEDAIKDYSEAIRINSNDADAYYNRGNAKSAIDDKQSAIEDYQKAADLYKQQGKTSDEQDAINKIKKLS